MKAREFLDNGHIEISHEVDARKEKIAEVAAWEMLSSVAKIYIGRGKKYHEWVGADNREEIMAQAMGRSGGLRAPALKSSNVMFVGFCEDMYKNHIQDFETILKRMK